MFCTIRVHLLERLLENVIPDTLTDQTSAHDPLIGYWPHEIGYEQAKILREEKPDLYIDYSYRSMFRHVQLMVQLMDKGAITFDYGNNIRARAREFEQTKVLNGEQGSKWMTFTKGYKPADVSTFRFVPLYPSFILRRKGPFPLGCAEWRPQ